MVKVFQQGMAGPGRIALARFFLASMLPFMALSPIRADAQSRGPGALASQAVPDANTVAKLIWSAMAALDHANLTGNYSVLRDLGAPSFQAANSAAALAAAFQPLRAQGLDISSALIITPNFEIQPTIVEGGLLRMRGSFPLRPTAIGFDLLFQNVGGRWRIYGISATPLPSRLSGAGR